MIIKSIEVKDWGPHKHRVLHLDGSVVGILGQNGAGKSNLLQALDYAFTGNLDKKVGQSYIRNFGMPDGATKASVKVSFEKEGKVGSIYREIGPRASKRLLEWDGQQYTKAEDVKRLMGEIQGADEHAVRNAVFIKQGDIANLIKGTPAERNDIFRKLVNLHFVDSRVSDVAAKIAGLRSGIRDRRGELTVYEEQEASLAKEYEDNELLISRYDKLCEAYSLINDLVTYTREHSKKSALYDQSIADQIKIKEQISAFLHSLNCTEEELQEQLQEKLIQQDVTTQQIKLAERYAALLKRSVELRANIAANKDKLKSINLAEAQASSKSLKETIASFPMEAYNQYEFLGNPVSQYATALAAYQCKHAEAEAAANKRDTLAKNGEQFIADKKEQIYKHQLLKEGASVKLKMLESGTSAHNCPICGAEFVLTEQDTQARLLTYISEVNTNISALHKEIGAYEARYTNSISACSRAEFAAATAKEAMISECANASKWLIALPDNSRSEDDWQKRLATMSVLDIEGLVNHCDTSMRVLHEDYTNARMQLDQIEATIKQYDTINLELKKDVVELDNLNIEIELLAIDASDDNTVDALYQKLEGIVQDAMTLNKQLTTLKNYREQESCAARSKATYENDVSSCAASIDALYSNPLVQNVIEVSEANTADELWDYIYAKKTLRDRALETSRELSSKLRTIRGTIASIHVDMIANYQRVELINNLELIQGIIGKNGVAMRYMQTLFSRLAERVQDLLYKMDANFTVSVDPEHPVTFLFTRTDDDSGFVMSQEQLSGGQAIRLSLALLIACQQLILPEVGLLVLDEPSSHIDVEGVISMRNMFANLSQHLATADMQIIIVDHNPDMMAAFDQVEQLTKQ